MNLEDNKKRLEDIYEKNKNLDEIISLCKKRLYDSLVLLSKITDFEFDILDLMNILRKEKVNYNQEEMLIDLENDIVNDYFYELYHPDFWNSIFNDEGFCATFEFEYELENDEGEKDKDET